MFSFLNRIKINYFARKIPLSEREKIIGIFFNDLSALYGNNVKEVRVPIDGRFELDKHKFYFEIGKELLKRMRLNVKIEKGTNEENKNYFSICVKGNLPRGTPRG